jgi:two-component system nitrate/nitrite response regulator NarL
MVTPLSVSIAGEERTLTEALSIALRTRGVPATVISIELCEAIYPAVPPDVLILASYGSCEHVCVQVAAARAACPRTKIIVLCGSSDKDLSRFVLENVAQCVLTADSFEKLLRALETLREVGSPDHWAAEATSAGRLSTYPVDLDPGSPELTSREQDVFKSISAGLSNKEIADLFSISPSTVKNHVHNILTKLNIRRRRYALGCTYVPRLQDRSSGLRVCVSAAVEMDHFCPK